jgi:protein-tyrosine kinase
MIFGPRSSWRFGRRSRALRRAATRFAAAEVGAWRRPPRGAASARLGHARATVLAAAREQPSEARAANRAAEVVLEQAQLARAGVDLPCTGPSLVEQLEPACRAISATAFAPAARRRGRLILVTSPSGEEGKSLTAVHLALALSRQGPGRPVLLVDGDPDTATAAQILAWPPQPGLSDVLAGDARLADVIGDTGCAQLSILPPGRPLATLSGLLASHRLAEVIRALLLRQPSGLVVIDGPPLLAGVAAAALAAYAEQVVLLIAAGRTSRRALDEGLRRLGDRDNLHCIFARFASSVRASE